LYYRNNVVGTFNLIEVLLENDINNIVFSSTAAIFGNPCKRKISEDHPKKPINPYGTSKLMVENFLEDIWENKKMNSTSLRYFNAAGAHESGEIGECHDPETHLIPVILKSIIDSNISLKVFGDDYQTHDGTCIRDYIHVYDLCNAHILSLENMINNEGCFFYNLGNGNGFSVKEVIKSCEKVTKRDIAYEVIEKRSGDPDRLVSNSNLAFNELNWKPKYTDLDEIISSAWNWHNKQS
jgi:UDP-glucose 4-epimerase